MRHPTITLLTDFGLSDHFVGTMKGVILRLCPAAQVVDISHQVTPYEVTEAAFVLAQAYRFFPKKTVHGVVMEPGGPDFSWTRCFRAHRRTFSQGIATGKTRQAHRRLPAPPFRKTQPHRAP